MLEDSQFSLSPRFWKEFARKNWRKKPTVIRNAFRAPIYQTSEAFNSLLLAGELRARGSAWSPDARTEILLFVGEEKQTPEKTASFFPKKADGSLEGYVRRCEKLLRGKDFGILVPDFQQLDFALWNRSRYFLKGLYEVAGLPAGRAYFTFFLSKYSKTPFGVHKDIADVFCFVLSGKKKIRTWPFREFFDAPGAGIVTPETDAVLGSIDYRKNLSRSTLLEGEPGDILYWPSSHWHIAEEENSDLVVTVNLGLQCRGSLFNEFMLITDRRIKERELERDLVESLAANGSIPAGVSSSARRYLGHLKSLDFETELMRWWLARQTGAGFTSLPMDRLESCELDRAAVRIHEGFPLSLHKAGSKLLLAASGHVLDLRDDRGLRRIIKKLNAGETVSIRDLKLNRERRLIGEMLRLRMLTIARERTDQESPYGPASPSTRKRGPDFSG